MNKYKFGTEGWPEPQDATNGLVYAAGHKLVHLAIFLTMFAIRKYAKNLNTTCELDHDFDS